MLDPKGNTAVYVLYAYARIAGVLRRAAPVAELSGRELRLVEPSDARQAWAVNGASRDFWCIRPSYGEMWRL